MPGPGFTQPDLCSIRLRTAASCTHQGIRSGSSAPKAHGSPPATAASARELAQ